MLNIYVSDLSCTPPWVKHRDRCVQEGGVRANYSEAAEYCKTWGGELLTLDQMTETGEILSLFQTTGIGGLEIKWRGINNLAFL